MSQIRCRFVGNQLEVWTDEATVVDEYADPETGDIVVTFAGGWVKPNEYLASIIYRMGLSVLRERVEELSDSSEFRIKIVK